MRTTLTLDDDVAARLREETQRRSTSFKGGDRQRLPAPREAPEEALAAPFTVEPRPMGPRAGMDVDDVGGLPDLLDGPNRR